MKNMNIQGICARDRNDKLVMTLTLDSYFADVLASKPHNRGFVIESSSMY